MSRERAGAVVLVVDDHPLVRSGIRAAVVEHDSAAHVDEAGCAAEAFARLAASCPDMVLLDVNVPGNDGRGGRSAWGIRIFPIETRRTWPMLTG